jgi:hypothetical protein
LDQYDPSELATGFDPAERAFYYARVLEIPTARWMTYDAKYWNCDAA